jgi:hypothetical protein
MDLNLSYKCRIHNETLLVLFCIQHCKCYLFIVWYNNMYLFFIGPFLTIFHWKSNNVLHHKVNGPCFIFSLIWLPSLCLMGTQVVYLTSFILPLFTFSIITFCLSEVCFWVEYDNVVLHRLLIFQLPFTYWLTLRRIPRTFDQMPPSLTFSIANNQTHHVTVEL